MIIVKEKIKPKDIDEEYRKLESLDKPDSIYPKILELPEREPKRKAKHSKYNPSTNSFESFMESIEQ